MADRNPYIPSERRQDVQSRDNSNNEKAVERFTEQQARQEEEANLIHPHSQPIAPTHTAGDGADENKDDNDKEDK